MPGQPVNSALPLLRMLAGAVSVATALAIVFAVGAIAIAKAHGIDLIDVLTAPIAFVFYAGPPLVVLGLASRAQRWAAGATATVLAVLFAAGLVVYGGAPWHFQRWQANPNDVQTAMLIATLFGAWPVTIVGTAIWRVANRESD